MPQARSARMTPVESRSPMAALSSPVMVILAAAAPVNSIRTKPTTTAQVEGGPMCFAVATAIVFLGSFAPMSEVMLDSVMLRARAVKPLDSNASGDEAGACDSAKRIHSPVFTRSARHTPFCRSSRAKTHREALSDRAGRGVRRYTSPAWPPRSRAPSCGMSMKKPQEECHCRCRDYSRHLARNTPAADCVNTRLYFFYTPLSF